MDESVHGRSGFSRLQTDQRKIGAQFDQLVGRTETVSGDSTNLAFEVKPTDERDHDGNCPADHSLKMQQQERKDNAEDEDNSHVKECDFVSEMTRFGIL